MTNEMWRLTDEVADEVLAPLREVPAPLRASALRASAHAIVDGQQVTIFVLVHADAADAAENAARLERNLSEGGFGGQPWRERFESWTVTADGPLVTAVIRGGRQARRPPPR